MNDNNHEIPPNATIRQEYVKCGNPDCQNSHGPYLLFSTTTVITSALNQKHVLIHVLLPLLFFDRTETYQYSSRRILVAILADK